MRRSLLVVVVLVVAVLLLSAAGAIMNDGSKSKETAIVPNRPSTPSTPVTPTAPATPTTPVTPVTPTTPGTSDAPTSPTTPVTPVTPIAPTSPQPSTTGKNVTVDFIDVGQGDSELITTPDSKHILIDAGPSSATPSLLAYLEDKQITKLDDFIATHTDADHIGGAEAVIQKFVVGNIYYPGNVATSKTYSDFMAAAKAEDCPIYTNAQLSPGDMLNLSNSVSFQLLWIDANATDANSSSIVLRMTYDMESFMFMGDAPIAVEDKILTEHLNDSAQVLKVGHHGSQYASSDEWLTAVDPQVGVIEVGAGNPYGHPTNATLGRLADHGVTVFRTDLNGTVEITSNGTGYAVSVQKHSNGVVPPTPSITVPDAPTNLRATAVDGGATVSWSSPSKKGGAEINGYGIYIDGVKENTTTGTSIGLSGLTNGFTYQIGVSAMNSAGESNMSATVPVVPMATSVPTPATDIVVNEVESNPAGSDAGHEWVELYNPSDENADLGGWSVAALHGDGHSYTIPSGASIAAHGYYVVNFTAQFLDNSGEVVVLYSASHSEVDRTPVLNDTANDGYTWQRVPNGTDTGSSADWLFRSGTRGDLN